MVITEGQVAQVASELKSRRGGVDNDYFGLLFLEKEFKLSRDDASEQIAYAGNDFGIDGYHVDRQAKNLHLLQFKFSKSADQFIGSMQRLITAGLASVFDAKSLMKNDKLQQAVQSPLSFIKLISQYDYHAELKDADPQSAFF